MKKIVLTIALVLGMGIISYAQNGGLFGYGEATSEEEEYGTTWIIINQNQVDEDNSLFMALRNSMLPGLPGHGESTNQNAPLGGGALLLIGFGAAYAAAKKRKKQEVRSKK